MVEPAIHTDHPKADDYFVVGYSKHVFMVESAKHNRKTVVCMDAINPNDTETNHFILVE